MVASLSMGRGEHGGQFGLGESLLLARALHLDELPVAGGDDVHVGLGAYVLGVGQVKHRQAVDDAHRHGSDRT